MTLEPEEKIIQIELGIWDSDTPFLIALTNAGRIGIKRNLETKWQLIDRPESKKLDEVPF
jgi:hypothetical protein